MSGMSTASSRYASKRVLIGIFSVPYRAARFLSWKTTRSVNLVTVFPLPVATHSLGGRAPGRDHRGGLLATRMRVDGLNLDGVCYEVRETLRMRVAAFAASVWFAAGAVGAIAAIVAGASPAAAQQTQVPTLRAAVSAAPGDSEA